MNDVPGISVNDWISKRQEDINRRTSIQHDFDCEADNEEELEGIFCFLSYLILFSQFLTPSLFFAAKNRRDRQELAILCQIGTALFF